MKLSNIRYLQKNIWAILLPAFLLSACGDVTEEVVEEVIRPVKIHTVGGGNEGISLEFPGVVEARKSVELGFEVQGKIIELPIIDGKKVTKGEVLAKLDPTNYLAARDSARSDYTALNSAYQRAKKIFDLGAGSQAEVDATLRDVRVATEQLKTAQKALDDTVLVSPFSGEVARKIADNFQNIQAKEAVLLLQDISNLEIDIAIPEQDFAQIDTTLTLEQRTARVKPQVEISALPGKRYPARFKSFASAADPVTRTYKVTIEFDTPDGATIFPGMTGKAIITPNGDDNNHPEISGFLVPVSSVTADEKGNAYAWVLKKNTTDASVLQASKVSVELGPLSGSEVRVLSGLNTGDMIAMSGVHYLREGMKVRPLGEK